MQAPSCPVNEQERLALLRSCGVLDTPAEAEFDGLAHLAAEIAQVPIALVSLVDADRQWFKAKHGIDAVETPRSMAFCAHAILDPSTPLVVPDAHLDARFVGNPLVDGPPRVIFYAGVPLNVGPQRLPLGTLCVIDHQPRQIDPKALKQLRLLARQAELMLDLRLRQRQVEDRLLAITREEERIRTIVSTMDEGLVVQHRDGRIMSCNPAAERILGLTADQMMGRTSMDPRWRAIRDDGSPFPGDQHPAMVALATGQPVPDVVMGVGLEGDAIRWIRINAHPMERDASGVPQTVVCSFADISADRAQRVALTAAKEEAERADRAKSEFLATMSHEIRTPMNGVIGLTDAMLGTRLDDDQRSMLRTIRDSGRALLDILNDILDWSRIEAGRMELESSPVDAAAVLRDVVTVLAPQAAGKGLELAIDIGEAAEVQGDAGRIRQVLFNIVGNAIKFTAKGSVTVRFAIERGACCCGRFTVIDTGIGIPADRLPRLFQRFSQVDASTTRRFGGSGLGLAISKHLITLMHGRIAVTSADGQGSTFTVELPLAKARTATAIITPEPVPSVRPLRLLMAEDNRVNQRVAIALLTQSGHQVEVAGNGIEAVAAFRRGGFDAVLMDVQMPDMDGLTATREIRSIELTDERRVPIIALTASALPEERAACIAAGMDDVLAKPITRDALDRMLAQRVR